MGRPCLHMVVGRRADVDPRLVYACVASWCRRRSGGAPRCACRVVRRPRLAREAVAAAAHRMSLAVPPCGPCGPVGSGAAWLRIGGSAVPGAAAASRPRRAPGEHRAADDGATRDRAVSGFSPATARVAGSPAAAAKGGGRGCYVEDETLPPGKTQCLYLACGELHH